MAIRTKAKKPTAKKQATRNTKKDKKEETEQKEARRTINEQLKKYRSQYEPHGNRESGVSLDNGDDVATFLRAFAPDRVVKIASALLDEDFNKRYGHLNAGQRRMNAGNRIRNAIKRGDTTMKDLKKAARA